jgi:3-oxoacyl-[acyl-carrier protein] reductase
VIRTPINETVAPDVQAYMVSKIPVGRLGEPSEVAEIIAFAASKACSFTTGFTFDVSGGRATY